VEDGADEENQNQDNSDNVGQYLILLRDEHGNIDPSECDRSDRNLLP
jgi:hypothetical protein